MALIRKKNILCPFDKRKFIERYLYNKNYYKLQNNNNLASDRKYSNEIRLP